MKKIQKLLKARMIRGSENKINVRTDKKEIRIN